MTRSEGLFTCHAENSQDQTSEDVLVVSMANQTKRYPPILTRLSAQIRSGGSSVADIVQFAILGGFDEAVVVFGSA